MNDPDNKRFYSKMMTYSTFVLMFLVLGLSFYSKEIIRVLAQNPDYWISYSIVPVISLGILFSNMKGLASYSLEITKKTRTISIISGVITFLNLGLNLAFIPFIRSMGSAIAFLLTNIIFFFLTYYFAQKHYPVSYEKKKLVKIICTGVFLLAIALSLNEASLWIRLTIKTLCLAAFPIILYFWKCYEDVELRTVREGFLKIVKGLRKRE
jgi:O-antigen/teichoic acid export membrane protein